MAARKKKKAAKRKTTKRTTKRKTTKKKKRTASQKVDRTSEPIACRNEAPSAIHVGSRRLLLPWDLDSAIPWHARSPWASS